MGLGVHDKAEAVKMLKGQGYSITEACCVLWILRSDYYYRLRGKVAERKVCTLKDAEQLERVKGIRAEHPFWGYRRVWA